VDTSGHINQLIITSEDESTIHSMIIYHSLYCFILIMKASQYVVSAFDNVEETTPSLGTLIQQYVNNKFLMQDEQIHQDSIL